MMKFRKRKLNNKGLSLVEILVTVVIVAIISAPIIDSFMHAIKVNSKARTIQNGTSLAQDTAEQFKLFDVQFLIDSYNTNGLTITPDEGTGEWKFTGKDNVVVSYDGAGVYKFSGIPKTGADGESFLVDVTLDPTMYADGENKPQINNKDLPKFSGLYDSDSIMLYRQYAGPDETLATLFEGKGLSSDVINNINSHAVRKSISKSTVIDIDCIYQADTDRFTYSVKVIITYEHDGGQKATAVKQLERSYSGTEIHKIYVLTPVFDRYSNDFGDGIYKSSDKIEVNYTYIGDINKAKNMYFYIAEQDMNHINVDSGSVTANRQRLQLNNINIKCYHKTNAELSGDGTELFDNNYSEYIKNIDNLNLKVYTNIGKSETDDKKYGLTYGDYNTGTSLYDMEVAVKLEGSNDTIATFNTAK